MEQTEHDIFCQDKKRLLFKEFVPLGRTLKRGEEMRVSHETSSCTGDSKSLKIKRMPSGSILALCFRCRATGVWNKDKEVELPTRKNGKWVRHAMLDVGPSATILPPSDARYGMDSWPIEARAFINKARIKPEVAKMHNIGYSSRLRKIVLPLYKKRRKAEVMVGYQLRRIFADDTSPKYITRKNEKDFFAHYQTSPHTCCVVEDMLSAIRVSKFVSSMCIFGVHVSDEMLNVLAQYERVIIFLDNDNAEVKRQQMGLKQELGCFVKEVHVLKSIRQPKELSDEDLEKLIDSYTYSTTGDDVPL